jgi:hypothetical protein
LGLVIFESVNGNGNGEKTMWTTKKLGEGCVLGLYDGHPVKVFFSDDNVEPDPYVEDALNVTDDAASWALAQIEKLTGVRGSFTAWADFPGEVVAKFSAT